jgi:hypothetical protein
MSPEWAYILFLLVAALWQQQGLSKNFASSGFPVGHENNFICTPFAKSKSFHRKDAKSMK